MMRSIPLILALVLLPACTRSDPAGPHYQIVDHDKFLVRLDTRTGEMRAFVVGRAEDFVRAEQLGLSFFEVARIDGASRIGAEAELRLQALREEQSKRPEREAAERARLDPCLQTGKSVDDCRWQELQQKRK